jgi:hypothetical protein
LAASQSIIPSVVPVTMGATSLYLAASKTVAICVVSPVCARKNVSMVAGEPARVNQPAEPAKVASRRAHPQRVSRLQDQDPVAPAFTVPAKLGDRVD